MLQGFVKKQMIIGSKAEYSIKASGKDAFCYLWSWWSDSNRRLLALLLITNQLLYQLSYTSELI